MSTKYRLPVTFGQNCPTQQSHDLFATAMLLVRLWEFVPFGYLVVCSVVVLIVLTYLTVWWCEVQTVINRCLPLNCSSVHLNFTTDTYNYKPLFVWLFIQFPIFST